MAGIDEAIQTSIDQKARFLKTPLSEAGRLPGLEAHVDVIYMHDVLADTEFKAVVNTDLLWSVMSFGSVFAYTVFHTRSFMMAAVGMFSSTMAYPAALLIYRVVFRVRSICPHSLRVLTTSLVPGCCTSPILLRA